MIREHDIPCKPLLLIGGNSTRMGEPKHLLVTPSGKTMLQHSFEMLSELCPATKVYVSLAQETPIDSFLRSRQDVAECILDLEPNCTVTSAGPAKGLLAAFRSDPKTTWLVLACDYPLLTAEALRQLCGMYAPPVTCFRNADGFYEPLIGIWSAAALETLADNLAAGIGSPAKVVKQLDGLAITPPQGHEDWLLNVNTRGEWDRALGLWREVHERRS